MCAEDSVARCWQSPKANFNLTSLNCASSNKTLSLLLLSRRKYENRCCCLPLSSSFSSLYLLSLFLFLILIKSQIWKKKIGIPITPRRLFSRTKTPRRKVRDPTSTLPKCPRCEKSKIRKVVDTKFPRYDHYTIRKESDAKTPRYNKSHTRELPDCIEIENSVACVEYKLERRKIQFSCTQDFFITESCRFEFRYRSIRSQLPPPPPPLSLSLSRSEFFLLVVSN